MRKSIFSGLLFCTFLSLVGLQSCKDDSHLLTPPPIADQSFREEFDTTSASFARGWKVINASVPHMSHIWQQGGDVNPWFSPFSSNGSYAGFIGASAEIPTALPGTPIVSNWLVSPVVIFQNGDKIIFHTRTRFYSASDDFGNRLQLRMSKNGESLNVGSGANPGAFTDSLLDINPTYLSQSSVNPKPNAYPSTWTRFEATITGLNQPTKGRFAFRYFIEDVNNKGWGVGIDQVQYLTKK